MFDQVLRGAGLSSAFIAGVIVTRVGGKRTSGSIPVLTLACFSVIAVFSLAQLAVAPGLLGMLMRDASRGPPDQPWRLATSLLVQDGGWAGAAFNLVVLLAIGAIAERALGPLRWAVSAAISVMAAQGLALFWQPSGAGNSILNFGLAGAVCAARLMWPPRHVPIPAVFALVCFVLLFVARDIHGVAGVTGALVELAFSFFARGRGPGEPAA